MKGYQGYNRAINILCFARLVFAAVNFAARNGLSESRHESKSTAEERARKTGIRGETLACWYLRRHGYTLVARNYTVPGIKGEIDLIGYDDRALAFVEVKTRSSAQAQSTPEDAVNADKRRNLSRMARPSFVRVALIQRVAASTFSPSNRTPGISRWCACTNPPSAWRPSYHTNTADSRASHAHENGTRFAITSLGS